MLPARGHRYSWDHDCRGSVGWLVPQLHQPSVDTCPISVSEALQPLQALGLIQVLTKALRGASSVTAPACGGASAGTVWKEWASVPLPPPAQATGSKSTVLQTKPTGRGRKIQEQDGGRASWSKNGVPILQQRCCSVPQPPVGHWRVLIPLKAWKWPRHRRDSTVKFGAGGGGHANWPSARSPWQELCTWSRCLGRTYSPQLCLWLHIPAWIVSHGARRGHFVVKPCLWCFLEVLISTSERKC